MSRGKCADDWSEDTFNLFERKWSVFFDMFRERNSVEVLHDVERLAGVETPEILNIDDGAVANCANRLGLAKESLYNFLMARVLGVQDLYGRLSAQVLMFRQEDGPEAALTDLANESIVDDD